MQYSNDTACDHLTGCKEMYLISMNASFLQYYLQSVTSEGLYGLMYRTVSIVLNERNSVDTHHTHSFSTVFTLQKTEGDEKMCLNLRI